MSEYKYKVLLCLAQNTYPMCELAAATAGWLVSCLSLWLSFSLWFLSDGSRSSGLSWWSGCWWCASLCVSVTLSLVSSVSLVPHGCLDGEKERRGEMMAEKKEELVSSNEEWNAEHDDTAASRIMVTTLASASPLQFQCTARRDRWPGWRIYCFAFFLDGYQISLSFATPIYCWLASWAASAACFRCTSSHLTVRPREPFNCVARNQSFAIDSGIACE